MNIALCFSGHLRTIRNCYKSHYENILKKYNPDVFVHTWSETESATNSWHTSHMERYKVDESTKSFIKERYTPKKIEFEKEKSFNLKGNQAGTEISLEGLKSMTYSLKKSFQLMQDFSIESGKKYDYILRIRPDIVIKSDFLEFDDSRLVLFGNKGRDLPPIIYKGMDVNYRALDCLFVYNGENTFSEKKNPFLVYDKFEEFYCKSIFFHSPFVDYLIAEEVDFTVDQHVRYFLDWEILRKQNE